MFADDTNLFYSHKDVKTLFHFSTLNHWFKANKFSLTVKKTDYTFFHKPSTKGEIPLKIPELVISDKLIERKRFIKYLDVILDECI